jgi:hypothetical protein
MRLELDYQYFGKRYSDLANAFEVPSYDVLNANVRWNVMKNVTSICAARTCSTRSPDRGQPAGRHVREWRGGLAVLRRAADLRAELHGLAAVEFLKQR